MSLRTSGAVVTLLVGSVSVAAPAEARASAPVPAVAAANPVVWSWGSIRSADRAGLARGKVVQDRPGFVVNGKLYDLPGRAGCSWLQLRWVKEDGSKGAKTYGNCSESRPAAFSVGVGYVVSIEGRVCRGTSDQITGACSSWEGVWARGG
ncbi:hypothetical protein [Nonomuraea cavernae]|uniref:Secreted protein n=1 Tax=Nonomuraea cavernae TaxID=2045107 RepID=A0A917YRK4_9ACTN|nr:hypothetical protein [Nonomuraea cavernae]MCA2184957.1 hypothetical protein [Nonomuraea cavernae]GGO64971.1 hypothetical protein GCM10012289_15560 [Nonomuraea cavernae]